MRLTRFILALWGIVFFLSGASLRSQESLDSLSLLLKKTNSKEERLVLLNRYAEQVLNINPDSAMVYLDSAIELSIETGNSYELGLAQLRKGNIYNNLGDYRDAIEIAKMALINFTESKDTLGVIDTYSCIGISYCYLSDYRNALGFFSKGLRTAEELKDTASLILMLSNMAYIYNEQEDFDKALPYLLRSIYMKEGLPNELSIVMSFVNVSTLYFNLGSVDTALMYLDTAEAIATKWDLDLVRQAVYQRRGIIFRSEGKYDDAIGFLNSAFNIQQEMKNKRGMATSLLSIAHAFRDSKQLDSAFYYYNEAIEIADSNGYADIKRDLLMGQAQTYKMTGNFEEAIRSLEGYYRIKDSLAENDVTIQMASLESFYENEKKEQEIGYQETVIDAQRKALVWLIVAVAITLLLLVLALRQKRKKDLAYKSLVKANIEIARKQELNDIKLQIENARDAIGEEVSHSKGNEKYSNSGLSEDQKEQLLNDISSLMEKEKLYLKADLTVSDIADKLGVYGKYISQVINEKFDKNFYNFVNEYRINEARRMLISPEWKHLSIEGIGNSAGFNSKSSFNTAFKKFTGLTPSYFRDSTLGG